MPLLTGSSETAFKSNVAELMHAYESKGSIGTNHPKSKKAALKQALAIAYSQKRKGKPRKTMLNRGTSNNDEAMY